MTSITLKARQGYSVVVPASLQCITTYVLLEQESWFEFEVDFLLRYLQPGMTTIDIGANLGVYALPMAASVGRGGAVFAYEPGSDTRHLLQESIALNGLHNLSVSNCALSSRPGHLWLAHGTSNELNELKASAEEGVSGEMVEVVTLDCEQSRHAWVNVDFVKIDAEGQEARIVVGGRDFFSRHSPLIMYEVMNGGEANHQLRWIFEALGYQTYRLSGDSSYLVRVDDDACADVFMLNYFAAKPDRASKLMAEGLLVDGVIAFELSTGERAAAIQALLQQVFARELEFSPEDFTGEDPYTLALLAYAAYLYLGWPAARRHAALQFAHEQLCALGAEISSMAVLTTLSRVRSSMHLRIDALQALSRVRMAVEGEGETVLDVPFLPAAARFEQLHQNGDVYAWFHAATVDAWTHLSSHSTRFASDDAALAAVWLAQTQYADPEIRRRACLWEMRKHGRMARPPRLGEGHLNASLWELDARGVQALAAYQSDKV